MSNEDWNSSLPHPIYFTEVKDFKSQLEPLKLWTNTCNCF